LLPILYLLGKILPHRFLVAAPLARQAGERKRAPGNIYFRGVHNCFRGVKFFLRPDGPAETNRKLSSTGMVGKLLEEKEPIPEIRTEKINAVMHM
jgi:hypothetical protein